MKNVLIMNRVHMLLVATIAVAVAGAENKTTDFVATNEWQIVSEGQAIPRGLHVRIDLQTGVKEAKLLDESERGTALQSEPASTDNKEENSDNKPLSLDYKADIIQESLRKAKEHRDYAELRKAYKEFQKNFRTDAEIIAKFLEEYGNFSKTSIEVELKPKLDALENLEYLLHQIDNALFFIDKGGLDAVLLPIVVNETNTALRVSAMRVLGALTGNNPQAQIKVFERGFGSHLSQTLMTSTKTTELSAALHAFGTLLRKFPLAQQRIMSTSGTQALIGVIRGIDVELRIKAKAVTLINDLVLERNMILDTNNDAQEPRAIAQYALLDFDTWLQKHGYCAAVDTVLSTELMQLLDQPEVVEQFVVALEITESLCQQLWSQSGQLRHALLTVRNRFAHSDDEYRVEVSQMMSKLIEKFYENRNTRTEL